jgi:formate hydrogenlyase transcriptional activator
MVCDEEHRIADGRGRELVGPAAGENSCCEEENTGNHSSSSVIGNSVAIRTVLKKAQQVACTDSPVLILGETGTGKELIARVIHDSSRRKTRPMVNTNCTTLPEALIESELFGREKGAFTGALASQIGRFELADRSTIFLDEIGELPLVLQPKLLRVLQGGDFERLGSPKTVHVDIRIVAATNRNLLGMIKEGTFREDLFYRLNVFPIYVPPLREHSEDIPALMWHILNELGRRIGRITERIDASTMADFQKYSWPGNVRELRNAIERNLILSTGAVFRAELPDHESTGNWQLRSMREVEAAHLRHVLEMTRWRVRGSGGAAEVLGLKPTTLEARMKKHGIRRRLVPMAA